MKNDSEKSKSLKGRRVVVTRPKEQSAELRDLLASHGADVLEMPLIEIRFGGDEELIPEILAGFGEYDWLVFTSANGVERFFQRLEKAGKDARALGYAQVAAIGLATAEKLAAYGIRALAPAVVCVGCLSAFRGYAQGRQYMTPTAVSQIIEALCKLVLGLALSMWLLHIGQPDYIAAAGAIAGVTAGTILSLVYMAFDYLRHRPALRRGESCAPDRAILRRLLALAIPITLSSSMVSLITLIDTKLVQGRLQDALGYTLDQMRAAYGNYSACMDLYNLPSSLMVALTASVIPAVSAAVTQRDRRQSARIVRSSLRVTALLAFPMGLGLWALSDPLFRLFYRSYNAELGGSLLAVLGIASIFVCLMLITNSILQAYSRVSVPIVTMLVGGVVKIVLNYNLVALPSVNIHGAPIGTLVCFALTALLNLIAVARIAPFRLNYPGYFLRPLFASLVMAFAARGVYALAAHFLIPSVEEVSRLTLLLCVGIAIGVAVVIYGVLVLALHCIRRSDLELLPKGDKLARLLHIS